MSDTTIPSNLNDASLELMNLINQANVLSLLCTQNFLCESESWSSATGDLIESIKESAPDVMVMIYDYKHVFANRSKPFYLDTKPKHLPRVNLFYPPSKREKISQDHPGPIVGSSAHEAGVNFLSYHVFRTNFWQLTKLWDDSDIEAYIAPPPEYNARLLFAEIEWERYRVFGEMGGSHKNPGEKFYSLIQLSIIFILGDKSISNYLDKLNIERSGSYSINVVRQLAEYFSGRKNIKTCVQKRGKAITEMDDLELVKFLDFQTSEYSGIL